MSRVRYNVAATLDGYIASADHSTSWIIEDPSIDFNALYATFSTFLMGRRTYETMISFGAQNPLSGCPREAVIVVSRNKAATAVKFPETTVVSGDEVVNVVRALKREGGAGDEGPGKDVWVMGGGGLAGMLLDEGLVDGIEVAIMPVMVGEGVKMVSSGGKAEGLKTWKLKLDNVETKESGIVMTRYGVVYEDKTSIER
ncbi:dihydrofolate reductase [Pyrenochaeta sp. DS3sAY3a]|nr:dihydrofolate reductase [Pyrenochaeta sp. DS3sAY3a]